MARLRSIKEFLAFACVLTTRFWQVGLVAGDRLQVLKQQILQQSNFDSPQSFPLYLDRFPTQVILSHVLDGHEFINTSVSQELRDSAITWTLIISAKLREIENWNRWLCIVTFPGWDFMQLLTYMRLSRLQDPALFSKIVFEKDIMLDQVSFHCSFLRLNVLEMRFKLKTLKSE